MSTEKIDHVLGFIFDWPNMVYLIRKSSPKWQAGSLNGIGGKVAENEDPLEAMKRLGVAEVGYKGKWTEYAKLEDDGWSCLVYFSVVEGGPSPVAVKEDLVGAILVEDLGRLPSSMRLVCGVYSLIHAAVDNIHGADSPYIIMKMARQGSLRKEQEPEEGRAKED